MATDTAAPSTTQRFSLEEVSANPNLMMYEGSVVDVMSFKDEHPGGATILEKWGGQDITQVFQDPKVHGHSSYARDLLEALKVGVLFGVEESRRLASKYHGMLDVTKPFLWQIADLGENYHGWMLSQPVVRKLTLFPSPFLESMSRYPWWWIWVGMPPFFILGLYMAALDGVAIPAMAAWFSLGLLVWAVIEYTLHRFIFHIEVGSWGGNLFHFFAHGVHHLTPHDHTRLTFPPPFTFALAYGFWQFFKAITLETPGYQAMYSGFVVGYILYDTTHFLYHHTDGVSFGSIRFPGFFSRYLCHMRTHHNIHHFLNDNVNFGVSSPLLDHLFGTYQSKEEAEKLRMEKQKKAQ